MIMFVKVVLDYSKKEKKNQIKRQTKTKRKIIC